MSAFRGQRKLGGEVRPIIVNVCNFAKPAEGQAGAALDRRCAHAVPRIRPCAARAAFGCAYGSLAGTSVSRDFVELPSQLYEHWFLTKEVMQAILPACRDGEPIPEALIDKIKQGADFQSGVLHRGVHLLGAGRSRLPFAGGYGEIDPLAFEAAELARLGMPAEITCATARRISPMSSRATAIRPAITAISGRR
jgi:peptidyl-dipeptidase Dcp